MRVLFLAHAYPRSSTDPVGSFIATLARTLPSHGVQVIVSAPSAPALAPRGLLDGVEVRRFRYAPDRYQTLAYTGTMGQQVRDSLSGKLAMLSYLQAGYRAARTLIRTERIDVVHAHWWFPAGLIAAALRRRHRVPFVTTLHGSDLRLATSFPFGASLFRSVAQGAGAVTAVSSWLARGAESLSPGTSVMVAPMPVVAPLFSPGGERDPNRLLFVGKLSEQKGLHRLLHAMSHMRERATLTVVGAGRVDDRPVLQLAEQLGLAHRIEWLPLLTQAELAVQYRRAALHVVPALDEGLGLTAVESLLCETPVVGFESGGLPDIVEDGVAGRLVPPGDEQGLARALDALLQDPDARESMGRAGRVRVQRLFGPDAAAARYASVYRGLADVR